MIGSIDEVTSIGATDLSEVVHHVDATCGVHADYRSHSGGATTLGCGVACSMSTKQKMNTNSSTFTELVGVADYFPKTSCAKLFLETQGIEAKKNVLTQDNTSTIRMEENRRSSCSKRSRHLSMKYFYVTDAVKRKEVEVVCCPTGLMLIDFFTKRLQGNLFRKFWHVMLGHVHFRSLHQCAVSSSKERFETCKTNVNLSGKNLNNKIKLNNGSSSAHDRLKIARRIR